MESKAGFDEKEELFFFFKRRNRGPAALRFVDRELEARV